ncbi:hypothetical protein MACH09_35330 [Vibrio sp. MACH09]|uniref:alpha/beta hydrolase n=1 Tax=Vibrio sp. MACH09 TaxID=3025122 RepID=UPI00278EC8B7|nr:alpha/beta hydrolase [Vibrio sp. MACH09]GLO63025.1 hypothetical protein MACH09_35330 [Vibrio sp. MACH09]
MKNLSIVSVIVALSGCQSMFIPPVTLDTDGSISTMTGVIDGETASQLSEELADNLSVNTLVLKGIPGSIDDESSLADVYKVIDDHQLTLIVPAEGYVASGGTDMLLMSRKRVIEPGACIGVHSWAMGEGGELVEGGQLPRDASEHQMYLDFYKKAGIDAEFYWFTLEKADSENMHWMSAEEINRFHLSTVDVLDLQNENEQQRTARCENRIDEMEI